MNDFINGLEAMNNRKVDVKIEQAKSYFLQGITKSGQNNYQKFQYLELCDILPVVRQVCKDLKLHTRFEFNRENAILKITCCEDGSVAYFSVPVPQFEDKDAGRYMQNVGKIQTYAMRYLYIQAFEIAVPDGIDKNSKTSKQQQRNPQSRSFPQKSRDITDLARNMAEEMNNKGIPDTVENVMDYMKQEFRRGHLSPDEFRTLREKIKGV